MRSADLPLRWPWLCIAVLLALATVDRARADEPVDDEARQVLAQVTAYETKFKNLSMHVDLTRTWNEMKDPVGNRVKRTLSLTETVDSDGRAREEAMGQILIGSEASRYKLTDGTIETVFDGTSALKLQEITNVKGKKVKLGTYVNDMVWAGIDPREVTTHIEGKSISEFFAKAHLDKSTFQWVENGAVTILETAPVQYDGPDGNRGLRKQTAWIAPHLGNAVIYWAKLVQVGPDQPWLEYLSTGGGNYKEIAPGIFLPSTIYQEENSCGQEGRRTFIYRVDGAVTEWKVNQVLPADTFKPLEPEGVKIFDERKKSQDK